MPFQGFRALAGRNDLALWCRQSRGRQAGLGAVDVRQADVRRADVRRADVRRADAGVTLIEMMVVLVIIGIVAALIVPNVIGRPDEARVAVARADLKTIAASLEMYRLDSRSYPTTEQGLQALTLKPSLPPVPLVWAEGGYLAQMPVDPWGQAYLYRAPADGAPYELLSFGSDGAPGGDGTDADISTLVQGG